jgi:hypothetical protein
MPKADAELIVVEKTHDKAGVRHFGNSDLAGVKLSEQTSLLPAKSEFPKCLTPDRSYVSNRAIGWPEQYFIGRPIGVVISFAKSTPS